MEEEIKYKFKLLGKNIQKLRKKSNLSIEELSIKSGISRQYLQKIENGNAYGFAMSHLEKLVKVFDGNLKGILEGL